MNLPEIQLEDDNFIYNFTTGKIYKKWENIIKETGLSKTNSGYHRMWIEESNSVHRVLYEKYYNIKIPVDRFVDHIDRNRSNNCIDNLRLVTRSQNNQNKSQYKNNTSGHKNISWHKKENCWYVRIRKNDKSLYQKLFKNLDEAVLARNEAIDRLNLLGHMFSKI